MARKEYNSTIADYIILKIKCNCGHLFKTGLIPVRCCYDCNKDVNEFEHNRPIICPKCKLKHKVHFYDDMYSAYCEISTIKENNIVDLHEIALEYAEDYDNALCDYIGELGKIKDLLEARDYINTDKEILLKMALVYAISMMDAYMGNTFRYNVNKFSAFKQQYEENRTKYKNKCKPLDATEDLSFQNLQLIAKPYYKLAFNIDIPESQIIQKAVHIRNTIIHNNCREKDGYEYVVSQSMVKDLINEIQKIVHYINNKMIEAVCDKVITG